MRMMAAQQDAHARLRATVHELTAELERIDPRSLADMTQLRSEIVKLEGEVKEMDRRTKKKDSQILDLRRQLTKVSAEYEAISVAHSYSNAELSRIRANSRGRHKLAMGFNVGNGSQTAAQEQRNYPHGHTVNTDAGQGESRHHHRKIHFR